MLILLAFTFSTKAGTYSGIGDGSEGNPYRIGTLEHLKELCQTPTVWGAYFIQTADIDASQTQYWDDSDDNSNLDLYDDPEDATSSGNNEGFSPIGNGSHLFSGEYDGQGFEISNLYIKRPTQVNVGLFGYTDEADISNIGIENCAINGSSYTGSLVGVLSNSSKVSNSYSTGNVTGDLYVGGLIGYNYVNSSSINNYSSGDVSGTSYVGGLLGYNDNSSSINNYSTSDVSGNDYIGGLVGANTNNGTVSNSYSSGNVSGTSYVGGLVGFNNSTVTNSFWYITIEPIDNGISTGKTTAEMKIQSTFYKLGL